MAIDIGIDREGHSLRMLVFQALERYPTQSLLPFLHDRSAVVRTAAARHLQTRPGRDALEYGMKLLASTARYDREIGAFLLGQIGTPERPYREESVPLLVSLCRDKAPEVRVAALAALGHLKASEAAKVVERAKRDPEPEVKEMARIVLKRLQE